MLVEKAKILKKLQELYHTNPFVRLLNIQIDDAGPGWAKTHMAVVSELINMDDLLHGGALGTLVDNACGVAGRTLGRIVVTQNISTTYIRNIPIHETAHAECRVLHAGKSTFVMAFHATSDEGKLLCEGIATMFVTGPDPRFTGLWEGEEMSKWMQ